ncbi:MULTISPECIES: ABC transporter ATP-binding protein [unclassified Cupriavidus]|uniref:ABC transporter ATP-binding protein n=1 Tax=unclassified Cupriavidus TaxID=2640874 RepID=UPI00313AAD8A
MTPMQPLLEVEALHVEGANGRLLAPVSFALHAGRALTLLGESGSGKSVLAHAIMGTLPRGLRAHGRLVLGGRAFDAADGASRRACWGHEIALLPQEPWGALDPTMRVGSQLSETHALVAGKSRAEAWSRTLDDLRTLGIGDAAMAWPITLSGGMAQRAAFAITRAGGAPVLIVDEPTKGLDHACRDEIVARLRQALDAGCTVLTITHDIAVARALGGDVAVMLGGDIVERGEARTVLAQPAHAYTRALIAADPEAWTAHAVAEPGEEILGATRLGKRFGQRALFRHLDLTLHAGDRVAVTGPSGSGKSTLGNVLLGLHAADEGTVRRHTAIDRVRYQKLYQEPTSAFAPRRSIGQALADLCKLHRLDGARIAPLMRQMRLPDALLVRLPGEVSGGELQRFALLRALLLDPVFLFADEPTSRLDPITQKEVIDILIGMTRERGCALMLVTHDPFIAASVAMRRVEMRGEQIS